MDNTLIISDKIQRGFIFFMQRAIKYFPNDKIILNSQKEKEIKIFYGKGWKILGLVVIMACFRTATARVDIVIILIITNKIHFNCGIKIAPGIY